MTDTVVKDLVINVGTTAQIEAAIQGGTITENMLSISTDCGASSPNLFDVKWSDYLLSDSNWLRADTFSWNSGTTYSDMYDHLVADIAGVSSSTETIGSYTVTFYRASDGHKIVLANQETTVTNIYNSTGVAWYYILDTTNTRFKLPRTKFNFTGLRSTVGDYVAPGLPNITGNLYSRGNSGDYFGSIVNSGGAFNITKKGGSSSATYAPISTESGTAITDVSNLNASRSSSIYGNSSTVQPPATQMYLYFYAGQHTQTATEQTAGLNASLFSGKVDIDLSNMNPTSAVKKAIVRWGVPDYDSGVSITSPYTPTVDGIITAQKNSGYSTAQIQITNGIVIARHRSADSGSSDNTIWAIVKAGVSYTISAGTMTFYPFIGV